MSFVLLQSYRERCVYCLYIRKYACTNVL